MASSGSTTGCLRFGVFELDPASGELRTSGVPVKLPPQAFKLLALLAARAGDVVSREEIRQQLWGDGTFVDFEQGVNHCIRDIRVALQDDVAAPQFVATLPRRGYRFVAPVEVISQPNEPADLTSVRPPADRSRWMAVAGLAALGIGAAAYLGWHGLGRKAESASMRVMLAVLPFDNLSGDSTQEYLSDGLTEEMVTALGRLHPDLLGVIARTSAMKYKGSGKSVGEIGRELGVDYVLEGSVRRSGDHARVTAQLIVVRDQTHLWAATYDRELRDILKVESEVSQAIADQIALTLPSLQRARLSRARQIDPEAFRLYLEGRYVWNKRTPDQIERSVTLYEKALAIDPTYAGAYVGLADSYNILGNLGYRPPADAYPHAKAAASKALELDRDLAEARIALAYATYLYDRDAATAEREFEHALALNPSYASGRQWHSIFLASRGRTDEALAEIERARRLDPTSPIIRATVGWLLYLSRRFETSIDESRKVLELEPDFRTAHYYLGLAYLQTHRFDEAIGELEKAIALEARPGGMPDAARGYAWAVSGHPERARQLLVDLDRASAHHYISPYSLAVIHAGLGDKDRAFDLLEQAFGERHPWLVLLQVEPLLDPLRSDDRFANLVGRVGLSR